MQCRIFGSLEIDGPGGPIDLGGRKRRALVAYLLVNHGRPRALERIVDDLWEGVPSRGAPATVQTYVSQLRRRLEPIGIAKHAAGYALDLAPGDVLDSERFERPACELRIAGAKPRSDVVRNVNDEVHERLC